MHAKSSSPARYSNKYHVSLHFTQQKLIEIRLELSLFVWILCWPYYLRLSSHRV